MEKCIGVIPQEDLPIIKRRCGEFDVCKGCEALVEGSRLKTALLTMSVRVAAAIKEADIQITAENG